jgi:hypothetical protein
VAGGHPNAVNVHHAQLLWLARERDQVDGDVLELLAALSDANPAIATFRVFLALCAVEAGRPDTAAEQLARLAPDGFAAIPPDSLWLGGVAGLLETAVALGDDDRTVTLAGLLAPYAGQLVVVGAGAFCTGAVDRYLAMAQARAGRLDGAAARFERALALEASVASPPLQAWTRLWRATLLPDAPRSATAIAGGYTGALLTRRAASLA